MKKIISSIILFILLLVGCNKQNTNNSLIVSSNSTSEEKEVDIYDSNDVDIKLLKDNYCVFFEDLVFAESNKNHIFKIQDNKIVDHISYPEVELNSDNYNKVIGKDIIEAVKIIGCPTFIGLEKELSLDYSDYDGYLRRIFLKKENDKYIVDRVEKHYKLGGTSIFYDDSRTSIPTLEQIKKLKIGMCIDDAIKIVGKYNFIESESQPAKSIKLGDNKYLDLIFIQCHAIDCEHIIHSVEYRDTYKYFYLGNYILDGECVKKESDKEVVTPYVTNDDRFMDESKITIDYLKKEHCFFFDNMVFASDKKNHVFFIEDNKIKEHKIYDKIAYPKDPSILFDSVKGMNFLDTFNIIGIPTFLDKENSLSINYMTPYELMITLNLDKNGDDLIIRNEWVTYGYKIHAKMGEDKTRTTKVALDDCALIKEDMGIDEVIRLIGKAKEVSYIGTTSYIKMIYELEDGRSLELIYRTDYIKEDTEYIRINYECYYGITKKNYDFFGQNIYYLYVDSIEII